MDKSDLKLLPDSILPIGEVVAASTHQFTAQCIEVPSTESVPDLLDPPAFGTFVRVGGAYPVKENDTSRLPDDFDPFETPALSSASLQSNSANVLYGVVCHAEMGALEVGRPLTAFGMDEETLRREQPQLFELLTTRFTAILVAFAESSEGSGLCLYLPPRPPRPHAQVFAATTDETRRLTERLDFLRPLLLGSNGGSVSYSSDELVAALLRHAWQAHGGEEAFILRAGRELAALLPTEYDRLRSIINRILG